MSSLLKAKTIYQIACSREDDIEVPLITSHPEPRFIDILALTPAVLTRQRDALLTSLKKGSSIRLLTTNGVASLMWGRKQRGIFIKFADLAKFQQIIDMERLSDLFQVREMDWTPSVGMIVVNGRDPDGVAWVSIYTPDPSSSSRDKTCMELSAEHSEVLFNFYAASFRALWVQASPSIVTDERAHWEMLRGSINGSVARFKTVIAENSPDVKDFGFVIAMAEEFRYFTSVMVDVTSEQDPRDGQWYYLWVRTSSTRGGTSGGHAGVFVLIPANTDEAAGCPREGVRFFKGCLPGEDTRAER
jgi:hypothetical protein